MCKERPKQSPLTFSYYYSRIFPDLRAQHCNYATLLRYGNNLWYSVIFPMGPSLYSMLVILVRGTASRYSWIIVNLLDDLVVVDSATLTN